MRISDSLKMSEETLGLLYFAEISEFAKELHSEMEKVVLMDELPENWTYPLDTTEIDREVFEDGNSFVSRLNNKNEHIFIKIII